MNVDHKSGRNVLIKHTSTIGAWMLWNVNKTLIYIKAN